MTTVKFTVVTEVLMDGFNENDIAEMGKSIAQAGKTDIEGICQGSEIKSVTALPMVEVIDCLAEDEKEVAGELPQA